MKIRNAFYSALGAAGEGGEGGGTGAAGTGAGVGADTGDTGKVAADAAAAKAVADAAAAKAGTGASNGKDTTTPAGKWPENWRTELSADDKHQKTLARFDSPKAVWESYEALRTKVSSGELKAVNAYPDKGKPEEQAAWRKENGIPESPDKYDLKDLKFGDEKKPLVEGFLKHAHELNLPPVQAKAVLKHYFDAEEARLAERQVQDEALAVTAEETLRTEWGTEYKGNINQIKSYLSTLPNGVGDKLMHGRMKDGTPFFNDPDIARAFMGIIKEINPLSTIVNVGGASQAGSVEDRIAVIEKTMRENRKAYNADTKMQEELRSLYTFREKHKSAK